MELPCKQGDELTDPIFVAQANASQIRTRPPGPEEAGYRTGPVLIPPIREHRNHTGRET